MHLRINAFMRLYICTQSDIQKNMYMTFKENNLHFKDLTGNEEANSNWGKVDNPGRHLQDHDEHDDHGNTDDLNDHMQLMVGIIINRAVNHEY